MHVCILYIHTYMQVSVWCSVIYKLGDFCIMLHANFRGNEVNISLIVGRRFLYLYCLCFSRRMTCLLLLLIPPPAADLSTRNWWQRTRIFSMMIRTSLQTYRAQNQKKRNHKEGTLCRQQHRSSQMNQASFRSIGFHLICEFNTVNLWKYICRISASFLPLRFEIYDLFQEARVIYMISD